MDKKTKISLLVAGIVFILVVVLFWGTAFSKDNASDSYSGHIEVTEIDVNCKVPGKIAEVRVHEGDVVKAGQVLAIIDSSDLKAKQKQALAVVQAAREQVKGNQEAYALAQQQTAAVVKQAQAGVAAADALSAKAKHGTRKQQIQQAIEVAAKAKSAYLLADKTNQRMQLLLKDGAITAQNADQTETAARAAYDDWQAAKEQVSLAQEGAQIEDIDSANANVELYQGKLAEAEAAAKQIDIRLATLQASQAQLRQALGALDEVNSYLASNIITAPISGTVTMNNVDVGEVISSGMPILTISKLNEAWAEVVVPEAKVAKLKLSDTAQVQIPGFEKQEILGKIVRISALPDYATKKSTNESGGKDIVSFGVKVDISNKDAMIKPGMTAHVSFR